MFDNPEIQTAIVTFAAVIASFVARAAYRYVEAYVRKTPTKLDDRIFNAVGEALDFDRLMQGASTDPDDGVDKDDSANAGNI